MPTTSRRRTGDRARIIDEPVPDQSQSAVLRTAALFEGLAPEDVEAAISQFRVRAVSKRTALFQAGELGDGLFVILSGRVTLVRRARDGRERLIALLERGDEFGELCVFDPGPRNCTATAITDAIAAQLSSDAARSWIATRPYLAPQLLALLSHRLRRTNQLVADRLFVDVAGRVARQLIKLADRYGAPDGPDIVVQHHLSQRELACLVGCARETTNKTLRNFAACGWIELRPRAVVIRDRRNLARRACVGSTRQLASHAADCVSANDQPLGVRV